MKLRIVEAITPNRLYHGTSLKQFDKMFDNDFNVKNLYVGEDGENITDHYAEEQARKDNSNPVTIVFDEEKLKDLLQQDYHDEDIQLGQWYFSGNCKDAIVAVYMFDRERGKEVELEL